MIRSSSCSSIVERDADHTPFSLHCSTGDEMTVEDARFEPMLCEGRQGIAAHYLYSTAQTGPDGPSAAILWFSPGATSTRHQHTGFELIYVLEGALETEHGSYAAGSVMVMSPGSEHRAWSSAGCLLLVVWERPVRLV